MNIKTSYRALAIAGLLAITAITAPQLAAQPETCADIVSRHENAQQQQYERMLRTDRWFLERAGIDPGSPAALIEAVTQRKTAIACHALQLLAGQKEKTVIPALRAMLLKQAGSDITGRTAQNGIGNYELCLALARIGDDETVWVPVAIKLLKSDALDAILAATLLARYATPRDARGWDVVRTHWRDPNPRLAKTAMYEARYFDGLETANGPDGAKAKIDVAAAILEDYPHADREAKGILAEGLVYNATPRDLPAIRKFYAQTDADEAKLEARQLAMEEVARPLRENPNLTDEERRKTMQDKFPEEPWMNQHRKVRSYLSIAIKCLEAEQP